MIPRGTNRRILLDVGAHYGETARAALHPKWDIHRIYSFEPVPSCWEHIESLHDQRLELCRFGLWREDTRMPVHDPGHIGASIHSAKAVTATTALCDFRDAAAWFDETVPPGSEVLAKLNVEGAEVDIVRQWAEAGCLERISHLLIHFDVKKIPGLEDHADYARDILNSTGLRWKASEEILFGRNATEKTSNWLRFCLGRPLDRAAALHLKRAEFAVRSRIYFWRHPSTTRA